MRRFSDWLLVGLFSLLLGSGALASLHNLLADRDKLQQLADDDWNKIPGRFESLFNDHLAARKQLTAAHARLRMRMLHSSPTPRVWVGRDEWLFYNHNSDPLYHLRTDPDMPEHLDLWTRDLSARRELVEAGGGRFLVVFAPNKQSIYPEYLSTDHWQTGPTTLDRLLERCRRDSKLQILDLREPLLAAKSTGQIYLRFDSHWNQMGAYYAYAAIVKALSASFPQLRPLALSEFEFHHAQYQGCDLAVMVGLGDRLVDDIVAMAVPGRHGRDIDEPVPAMTATLQHVRSFIAENDQRHLPRAVMITDSFGEYPAVWLREHFSRFVVLGTYSYERAIIEREKPDVVIQLIVERQLDARQASAGKGRSH